MISPILFSFTPLYEFKFQQRPYNIKTNKITPIYALVRLSCFFFFTVCKTFHTQLRFVIIQLSERTLKSMLPAGRVHFEEQGCGNVSEKFALVTCVGLFHLEFINKLLFPYLNHWDFGVFLNSVILLTLLARGETNTPAPFRFTV